VVTTKETGRLLLVGGTKGYSSSNKVYQVDECMNTLNKHSKLHTGRVGHAAVYVKNKDIYVIGGYNADSNQWLRSMEICQDAFANVGIKDPKDYKVIKWENGADMKESRYYFGCCQVRDEHIYVFGGMNEGLLKSTLGVGESKCLNSIERYSIETRLWETIELKTYQKFPYCSHITAVHVPWDLDNILIVGG